MLSNIGDESITYTATELFSNAYKHVSTETLIDLYLYMYMTFHMEPHYVQDFVIVYARLKLGLLF